MENYELIGRYQDPSANDIGTVSLKLPIRMIGNLILTSHFEDKEFVGYITPVNDEQLQKHGVIQIQLIEYLRGDISKTSNIMYRAFCQDELLHGEFRGEKIESLDSIMFSTDYEKFNNDFNRAEKRGITLPLRFKLYK